MAKKKRISKKKVSKNISLNKKSKENIFGKLNSTKWQSWEWWILLGIVFYSLWQWWPTKNLPYHWDSAGLIIVTAKDFMVRGLFPLVGTGAVYAHVMTIPILLSLIWEYFGETILNSHLLMLPFLPILMISSYFIGRKLVNPVIGICAAMIVGFLPVTIAEYGIIYTDLPMAALTTTALALWLYDRYLFGSIVLMLAMLVKLPAIIMLIPLGIYLWWQEDEKRYPQKWQLKKYIYLFVPILVLAAWLGYHYYVNHWFLVRPDIKANLQSRSAMMVVEHIKNVLNIAFYHQNKILFTIVGITSVGYLAFAKKIKSVINADVIALISGLFISVVFFMTMYEFGSRYSIFMFPLLVIIALYFLYHAFNIWYVLSVSLFSLGLMMMIWHPKIQTTGWEFLPKDDLSYMDIIKVGQEAATYVYVNYEDAEIFGAFPENYQLTQPFQGYVKEPLNFNLCENYEYKEDVEQIIYLHAYTPKQMNCRQLLDILDVKPLKRFESNGKWMEVYLVLGAKENNNEVPAPLIK